jgi:sporulation protein YlmC with PRC-barrel domain
MRLSDLRDKKVFDESGKALGRVHEVHCDGGRVTALKTGPGGLIERLTDKSEGRRIAWESVVSVGPKRIVVACDGAAKKKPASGPRTPPRTRRPSAPRSGR